MHEPDQPSPNTAPTVSVVIATYNYGAFLPKALDSVLTQTFADYEIIVVNDGSTDNTDEVVKPYLEHPKVRYYKKANGGQATAKNLGISKAKGEYVAFLDADDFWLPEKLERQLKLFRENPAVGVVYSAIRTVGPEGEEVPFEMPACVRGKILKRLYGNSFICFSSSMMRRELFEKYGVFDESFGMAIDYDLWLRLSLVTEFDFVPEPLVFFRLGHGQMSSNLDGRDYWARFIEKRFRESHPERVTPEMMKDCEFDRIYTRFRRFEKGAPLKALRAILQMARLRPWSRTPYRSLGRLIFVDMLSVVERK
jgi:glycosyltransferase involved in cell wall biosynthesis